MPLPHESPELAAEDAVPPRQLGRFLAVAFGMFFLMVALGVFWVWQRFSREKAWRDQVGSQETFVAPSSPPQPGPARQP